MPLNAGGQTAPEPEVDLFPASGAPVPADETGKTEVEDDDLFILAEASRSTEKIREGKIRKPFLRRRECVEPQVRCTFRGQRQYTGRTTRR